MPLVAITPSLLWFLDTLKEAVEQALLRIDRVLMKATFWQRHATTVLNERQIKVLGNPPIFELVFQKWKILMANTLMLAKPMERSV